MMVIGKSANPRCFRNFNPESFVYYRSNKKAWMTAAIFNEWLDLFDQKMREQRKQAILILDNAPGHIKLIETTNTSLKFFPSNMTSCIQPLDAGIIKNLKSFYKSKLVSKSIEYYDCGKKFGIDMKDCILLLVESWISIKRETIFNCFRHCKIRKTDSELSVEYNSDSYIEGFLLFRIYLYNLNENLKKFSKWRKLFHSTVYNQ